MDDESETSAVEQFEGQRRRDGRTKRHWNKWDDLPWEHHQEAQELVELHPDGMTLEQIGAVMGITRERVRQIENIAFRKLNRVRRALKEGDTVVLEGPICEGCNKRFERKSGRQTFCYTCLLVSWPQRTAVKRASQLALYNQTAKRLQEKEIAAEMEGMRKELEAS